MVLRTVSFGLDLLTPGPPSACPRIGQASENGIAIADELLALKFSFGSKAAIENSLGLIAAFSRKAAIAKSIKFSIANRVLLQEVRYRQLGIELDGG
jgi:hypothetical protein